MPARYSLIYLPATTGAAGGAAALSSFFSSVAGVEVTISGTIGVEAVIREPAGISVVTEGAASEVADGPAVSSAASAAVVASLLVSAGAASSASFLDFSFEGERREMTRAERRRPSLVCYQLKRN